VSWSGITAQALPFVWERVERMLQQVPLMGATSNSIYVDLKESNFQLWIWKDFEFVLITQIVKQADGLVYLLLRYGVGKVSKSLLVEGSPLVLMWAKAHGCSQIEVAGRRGWSKLLQLRPHMTVYRGDL